MKYLNGFLAGLYGLIIGSLILPWFIPLKFFTDKCLPVIRQNPFNLLNPVKVILGIGYVYMGAMFGIALIPFVGIETAIASVNHQWNFFKIPFKLIHLYSNKYKINTADETHSLSDDPIFNDKLKKIIDINAIEKDKRSQNAIMTKALKVNRMVNQSITSSLNMTDDKDTSKVSTIITTYATEDYRQKYLTGLHRPSDIVIVKAADAATLVEHNLTASPKKKPSFPFFSKFYSKSNRLIESFNTDESKLMTYESYIPAEELRP